jgi:hypothetical protein
MSNITGIMKNIDLIIGRLREFISILATFSFLINFFRF